MLESLGACLTMACVYFYLVVVQDGGPRSVRWLGLALTLLFLTKYNYWLLVALGLAVGELVRNRAFVCRLRLSARSLIGSAKPQAVYRQLRNPLNYLLAPSGVLLLIGFIRDGTLPASRPSKMWPHPQITVYVAYLLFVARLVQWYLAGGREWLRLQPRTVQQLFAWHGLPILLWFLWPKRLAYCLWYLTRDHGSELSTTHDSLAFYWTGLSGDYHQAAWSLVLMGVLLGLGCLCCRRLRPGGVAVVICLLVIVALNLQHHSKLSRFMHSWIALAWVVAGAGFVQVLRPTWPGRLERLKPLGAGLAVLGLAAVQAPGLTGPGFAREGGCKPERLQIFEVPRSLPAIARSAGVTLVSNLPLHSMLDWTYLEFSGQWRRVDTTLRGLSFDGINRKSSRAGWKKRRAPLWSRSSSSPTRLCS